jgi:ATP-dependent helicase/nuclease subunit B
LDPFSSLLFALDSSVTILTGNRRLAHHLHINYDQYQQQQGKTAWETADILPWETWVERCWEEWSADGRVILNDFQEQLAWEHVIRETTDETLLQIPDIAKNAKEAWKLLQEWNLTLSDLTHFADENTLLFITWAKAFRQFCHQRHGLDRASLLGQLTQILTTHSFRLPKRILLAGFDLFTPQQQQLLTLLQKYTKIESLPPTTLTAVKVSRLAVLNQEQEIYHMAAWAHQHWQINPPLRIACIVPELSNLRETVNRIFTELFAPAVLLPGNSKTDLPFNISIGKSLAEYPLVQDALKALTLNFYEIDITVFSELLRSPFLGGGFQEAQARAGLDLELRRSSIKPRITLRNSFALAQKKASAHYCPIWAMQSKAFLQARLQIKESQLPSQWKQVFQHQLHCLGWPGDRALNSAEYQTEQRWQSLLDEFSSLDGIIGDVNLSSALHYLNQLASTTVFQPETPTTPIQILGHFEAMGLTFEAIWVMGLSDRTWPPPLTPNPLLPMALQQRLAMPKANVERELQFYRQLTQHFTQSAAHVIFSYPQQTDDYTLQASPLITDYRTIMPADLSLHFQLPAQKIFAQASLETWQDDSAPPLTPLEKIKGGAEVLKHQAACPLRAFAKCRLHAHGIPTPQFGLDNQQRGKLVHAALMNFWENIQTHTQLQNLSISEFDETTIMAVSAALRQFIKKYPALAMHYQKLESRRLQRLLQEWLTFEKQRAPFKVLAHEQTQEVLFAGLAMKLRLDRIDELGDGSQVIIDYKTGQDVSVGDWLGERPGEPQLPLYAVIKDNEVNGLLFAHVRAGKLQFKGITQQEYAIANKNIEIRADWPLLLQSWRNTLQRLAQDFCEGKATVDPKEQHKTCQHCDLQTFCRFPHKAYA